MSSITTPPPTISPAKLLVEGHLKGENAQ